MPTSEPWTIGRLLLWTVDYLKAHTSESPRLDAEVLLAEALDCRRIDLYTRFDETPSDAVRAAFRELVRRRSEGTPVAYLVGRREFYSLSFRVTPDVLIPRPETELLVVAILDLAKTKGEGREGSGFRVQDSKLRDQGSGIRDQQISKSQIPNGGLSRFSSDENGTVPLPSANQQIMIADVGTGSGIIAVCLAKHLPHCRVTAIDISHAALDVAAGNAKQHGVADRIEFIESDLFAALPPERRFDFIVSNPPYVAEAEMERLAADVRKFEPRAALLAGPRGTEVIESLIPQAAERLLPGGHLLLEISPMIHDAVRHLLEADPRFEIGPTIKDMARLPRVVQARKRG